MISIAERVLYVTYITDWYMWAAANADGKQMRDFYTTKRDVSLEVLQALQKMMKEEYADELGARDDQ